MFMRNNRAKNGAPQPEAVAKRDAPSQKAARKLSPNEPIGDKGDDWRFSPDMSSCAAINDAHYNAGVKGQPWTSEYEKSIPFVGNKSTDDEGERLSGRK